MGHFLNVAFRVLSESAEPLSAAQITSIGLQRSWLLTKGETPSQTMKSKLSTDILNNKSQSRFMRTAEGRFGLRAWKAHQREHVADRFKKALLDEDVVVFPSASLRKYLPSPGLHAIALENGRDLIAELRTMLRREAETDYRVIQLVSVFVVRFRSKYLTYKRTKRLPEDRLHGWYSAIFGGHLNPKDVLPLFDIFDPENAHLSFYRELGEEVRFPDDLAPDIVYRGLLYDDSRDVSRQHLGVVYDVHLRSPEYEIGERGFLMDAKFETLKQIKARADDFENWSVLLMNAEMEERQSKPI